MTDRPRRLPSTGVRALRPALGAWKWVLLGAVVAALVLALL